MKKLSLYIFLVLMWCNIGFAEWWIRVAETETAKEYIDDDSIGKEDGITYFFALRDYKIDYISPSQIMYYAVKCEVKQIQLLEYGWYDKHMGEGKFSGMNSWPLKEWRPAPPGTVAAQFIKYVCE